MSTCTAVEFELDLGVAVQNLICDHLLNATSLTISHNNGHNNRRNNGSKSHGKLNMIDENDHLGYNLSSVSKDSSGMDSGKESFDLAKFFDMDIERRITTSVTSDMIVQGLEKLFGKDKQFTRIQGYTIQSFRLT